MIFVMSSQPAVQSSKTSGRFVLKFIDIFYRDFDSLSTAKQTSIIDNVSFLIRKTAHFLEYFILGLLSFLVTVTYKNTRLFSNAFVAMSFCAIYAVSDEIHQYFVPGRACRFLDVCIDCAGSICAIVLTAFIISVCKRYNLGEVNEKKEIN